MMLENEQINISNDKGLRLIVCIKFIYEHFILISHMILAYARARTG